MINIAIIGAGYWGPNLIRNFMSVSSANVAAVCDLSEERLQKISTVYPTINCVTDYSLILNDSSIHAVAIATPVDTHFKLAKAALDAGKHVLLEKPMTSNSAEAAILIDLAKKKNRILLIDHTFIYMGAVQKLKSLIDSGELGQINYYDSMRVNLGLFQHDVNVAWDLAVHDLSILYYLLPQKPIAVSATGMSHVANQPKNVVYMTLFYENSLIAHINVNWLSPVKVRQTLISGSKKMIVFDDLHASEKIKIYDTGISVRTAEDRYKTLVEYRTGDVLIPTYDRTEALKAEAEHFIACINDQAKPFTPGELGYSIVKTLEATDRSLEANGQYTEI